MKVLIDKELRLPLIVLALGLLGFAILFSLVDIEDQRKHMSSDRAMNKMCDIKESYYSGWMGNVISRQAVARVWDLIIYEEGSAFLSKIETKERTEELLKDVGVKVDGSVLKFDFATATNGRSAESLARGFVEEIKEMKRSPSSSGAIRCFYDLSFDLFKAIKVVTPRGVAERELK